MDRQQWLKNRKIGSSDAPVIMGVSPWTTKYQLWVQKVTGTERADNANMQRGRMMEEPARQAYEKLIGDVLPAKNNLQHPKYDFMTANLDGLSLDNDRMVEIKNPGEKDHAIAKAGKIPEKYFPQCQHQLAIANALYGICEMDYFSYREGDEKPAVIVTLQIDDAYQKSLIHEEEIFWDMILSQKSPPTTAKDEEWQEISDEVYLMIATKAEEARKQMEHWEAIFEENKAFLIKNSPANKVKFGFGSLSKSLNPGAVQYNLIPELQNVNLDQYRKAPFERWTLKFDKKKNKE